MFCHYFVYAFMVFCHNGMTLGLYCLCYSDIVLSLVFGSLFLIYGTDCKMYFTI